MTVLLRGSGMVDAHDRAVHNIEVPRQSVHTLNVLLHDRDRAGLKLVVLDSDNRQLFYGVSSAASAYQVRGEFQTPAGSHTLRIRVSSPQEFKTQFHIVVADNLHEL
ncbi:hypothetical protein [Nocardia sp. NPDC020380]|uniref:hypothetical protein n=1 Tax=Nocardia sp. NPDC020380 TaxID=3364309 RepID=UPI0037B8EFC4